MSYTYRSALAGDSAACAQILSDRVYATEWMPNKIDELAELEKWWGQHFQEEHAWVAVNHDTIVGFCSRQRGSNNISALYVAPEHRRHGFGKCLLDLAKDGCNRIIVWAFEDNEHARKFYRREGLIEVDRELDDDLDIMDVEHRWTRHAVPVQSIIDVLKPQFPLIDIALVKPIAGFQQDLAELSMATPEQQTSGFLKCFVSHLSWWTGNTDSLFERELASIRFFEQANLRAPAVLATGTTDGVDWLLLDAMDAKQLSDKPINFDPERLALNLARMHAAEVPQATKNALTNCDVHYMQTRLREMADQSGCPSAAVDSVIDIVATFSQSSKLVFCHGDLHSDNIMVDEAGDITFFDFEESIIGYRQYDVAALAHSLKNEFSQAISDQFLQAYSLETNVDYPATLVDDWKELNLLLRLIVGIHIDNPDECSGLPVCRAFVQDRNSGKKRLEKLLRIRPGRDKLRELLGDDLWKIRDIDYDAKTCQFYNPEASIDIVNKLRDAGYLKS